MFLFYAAVLSVGAILLPLGAWLELAPREALTPIVGNIAGVARTHGGKSDPKLRIVVSGADQTYHLIRDDLTRFEPKLASLRSGDTISALIRPDAL